ncbi:MFS transporter [Nitrosococcus watsonii]|uniref:Major facilitator superfamily MFS_1 n=1 Tax=Nitrosococcus watsoni (strain C-113) TaxID=105559 RepID=D8K5P7_NITWC|nr:MFS transporter [Nitrosococcus watsonii]ADJ28224.1 major facilitator superfamily MFS_1 [Nitrosococcus watsonii C-113]
MSQHLTPPVSPIALALPVACTGATQSLLVIALPIILALTELNIGQLSPILGLAALGFLVGGYVWPRRVIRGQRRRLLGRLLLAAAISQMIFVVALFAGALGLIGTITLAGILFAARLTYGLTASGVFPTTHAWLASEYPEHARHGALTRMSATANAGRVLIPLTAAVLAMHWPEGILVLLVILPLIARLLLPHEVVSQEDMAFTVPVNRWPEAAIALPVVLIHMSLGLAEFIIGPYLSTEWNIVLSHAPVYTALLLAGIAACMVITQLVSLHYRLNPYSLLIWAPVGMALGTALAAAYPPALPAGLALMAISLALILPASAAGAAANRSLHTQAQAGADLYTARILGHLLGVTAAGPLFEIATHLPLVTAAVLALMAIPAGAKLRQALATGA